MFELQQAVDAYDFYQRQMEKCDQELRRYMAALPARATVGANKLAECDIPVDSPEQRVQPRLALLIWRQRYGRIDLTG